MCAKPQQDILGELFRGDQTFTAVPGLEELDLLIQTCVAPKVKRGGGEKKLLSLQNKHRKTRKKSTHYLSEDVYDGLTQANLALKRMLPDGAKSRASKSKLVNYALHWLLQEIEEKGEYSRLVKTILDEEE